MGDVLYYLNDVENDNCSHSTKRERNRQAHTVATMAAIMIIIPIARREHVGSITSPPSILCKIMQNSTFKLSPLAFAAFLMTTAAAQAQSSAAPAAAEPETLQTVTITASADASKDGLSKEYAGGQVARGGRMGILGNVDMMSAPFNSTNYTSQFVADQQASSIGEIGRASCRERVF